MGIKMMGLEVGAVSGTMLAGAGMFGYFSVDTFKEVLRHVPVNSVTLQPDFWSAVYCAVGVALCTLSAYIAAQRT